MLYDKRMDDDLAQLISSDPKAALQQLRTAAGKYGDQLPFAVHYGTNLMDIGRELRDESILREGILETRKVLDNTPPEDRSGMLLNIACALRAIQTDCAMGTPTSLDRADSDELSAAKAIFIDLNSDLPTLNTDVKWRFFTEFGNCLADMGRFLEALHLYENALALKTDDPVAIANIALSFRDIAHIARDMDVLREASALMGRALAMSTELDNASGVRTAERMTKAKEEMDSILESQPQVERKTITIQGDTFQSFCKKTQLFLNFCYHSEDCFHMPTDTLTFSVKEITNEAKFIIWVRTVNEIKQQFALSRLLLFEAIIGPGEHYEKVDALTLYLDLDDSSVYGMRSAKLKGAYQMAYNLFDKIAFFLNDYLQLGVAEKDVSFRSIWREKKKNKDVLRPKLLLYKNKHLRALYELSKEIQQEGHFGEFTDIRNRLTHRFVVLHTDTVNWKVSPNGDKYHSGYQQFSQTTIHLLGLAKAATIYLVAFVRTNELHTVGNKPHFLKPALCTRKDLGPGRSKI